VEARWFDSWTEIITAIRVLVSLEVCMLPGEALGRPLAEVLKK